MGPRIVEWGDTRTHGAINRKSLAVTRETVRENHEGTHRFVIVKNPWETGG
jgi:hypothetical protein